MNEAGIPPERIVVFAQSIGTAVALSLVHHLATVEPEPVFFGGMVLVAPFADVAELTSMYRIAGAVPLLSPLARVPTPRAFFKTFLVCNWPNKEKLADFLRIVESTGGVRYDLTIIHAMDDWDTPWSHSETLFWHASEAAVPEGKSCREVKDQIEATKKLLGAGGLAIQLETPHGVLRKEIVEHGLHDRIMSYPSSAWQYGGPFKQQCRLKIESLEYEWSRFFISGRETEIESKSEAGTKPFI